MCTVLFRGRLFMTASNLTCVEPSNGSATVPRFAVGVLVETQNSFVSWIAFAVCAEAKASTQPSKAMDVSFFIILAMFFVLFLIRDELLKEESPLLRQTLSEGHGQMQSNPQN